ncbi:MAG: nuclear transport factor 2 family protein [Gammaproteobacteria bacterium]|nr:nuclear transport factor 2 family protein [Gammaproteobacteria bacterium]
MRSTSRLRAGLVALAAAVVFGAGAVGADEPAAPVALERARAEIARLPIAYAWAVDHKDADALVGLFASDGIYDLSAYGFPDVRGHAALRRFFLESVFPSERCSFSSISNVRIELDGTRATGADYFIHFGYGNPKLGADVRLHVEGQHFYEFRLEQGRWKIARMRGHPTFERSEKFAAANLRHCGGTGAENAAPTTPATERRTEMKLASWSDYVELLLPAGELTQLTFDPASEQLRADLYRQFLMNLSLGYFLYFQSTPEHPEWAPFLNSVFRLQPNPDDTYLLAPVTDDGIYRVTGERGSVRLLTFLTGRHMMGMSDEPGENFGYFDADELHLGPAGELDFIISATRPPGWNGDWLPLHAGSEFIMVRQRGYDWGNEREAALAIERVDAPPLKPRPTAAETDERMRALLGGFTSRLSRKWLEFQNAALRRGLVNQLEFSDMGGSAPPQKYWVGMFQLAPGEALILETEIPRRHRYWNVQLNDELWNAVEFVYRQSSLNGHQARLDSDGRFRAVIALDDPGVPNWLDPGGAEQGMLIGRWYQADSLPLPKLTKVPFGELRAHLPADTPVVTAAARAEQLRQRSIGAQLRRRW